MHVSLIVQKLYPFLSGNVAKNEVTGNNNKSGRDLKIHSAGSLKMTSQHPIRAQIPTKCYAMHSTHITEYFKEKKLFFKITYCLI